MRISDWSSEVCSSDLGFGADVRYRSPKGLHLFTRPLGAVHKPVSRDIAVGLEVERALQGVFPLLWKGRSHRREHPVHEDLAHEDQLLRSEEHTSELQSLMRIPYAVFCLKQKNTH